MHAPRKRFGQHFLHDTRIISRLVDVIAPLPGQHLVEIGPGQGALTLPVLDRCGAMDAVELDRDLIPILKKNSQAHGQLTVHSADALEYDFGALPSPLRVIGNLPYNISTPLIFHLLSFANRITDMHFMLQKEVVDRLAAEKGDKDYGRLSIMVQYRCRVTALFDVPPEAFQPPPKVDSKIVRIVPHEEIPCKAVDEKLFGHVVRQAFTQRRKTLRNGLKKMVPEEIWAKSSIDPALRPEQLSVMDYVLLSNHLTAAKQE